MEKNALVVFKGTNKTGVLLELDGEELAKVRTSDGDDIIIHVDDIELAEKGPLQLLKEGKLSKGQDYGLRLQAAYLKYAYKYDPLSGLSNARVEPKLHQIFVARRVTQKLFPRMILADEVGLGKTIEAGLVIKELRARQIARRILVLCPASLQYQWKYELDTKFNEPFEIIDGYRAKMLGKEGDNPWKKFDGIISSLNLAVRPEHSERIVNAGWDMVVFDEAHRVRRTQNRTTLAYELADDLKEIADGLLLLSATPMQLDPYEMYSLIELIEPGVFPDYESYLQRMEEVPHWNYMMNVLLNWPAFTPAKKKSLTELFLLMPQHYFAGLSLPKNLNFDDENFRNKLINELGKKPEQVMIRNRKIQIDEFYDRHPRRVPVQLTDEELRLYFDVTDYIRLGYNRAVKKKNSAFGFLMALYQKILTSSSYALSTSFKNRITKLQENLLSQDTRAPLVTNEQIEQWLEADDVTGETESIEGFVMDIADIELEISQLRDFVDRLDCISDSKANKLINDIIEPILGKNPEEKILIFTQFVKTQEFLQKSFRYLGYKVAIFNGQMDLEKKEQEVKRFRRLVPIMITTEAGGEGRNFQFSHIMVNYDLPWNPMKVEQRIGRLDRIGQRSPVQIYNLFNEGTLEEYILDVLEKRIELFTKSVGSLEPILGKVEQDIKEIILSQMGNQSIKEYGIDLATKVREARLKEKEMDEFEFDKTILHNHNTNALLKLKPLAQFDNLREFIHDSLVYYGGRLSTHSNGGYSLSLSPLLTREVGATRATHGVFNPEIALEYEDLDFFAFGHDVIDKIISYVYNEGSSVGGRYEPDAPSGLSLEIVYLFESSGGTSPVGRMIQHFVRHDLQIWSQPIKRIPLLGKSEEIEIPDWLPSAVDASESHAREEYLKFRKKVIKEDNAIRHFKKERIPRTYQHRRQQLSDMIKKNVEWIEEKENFGSEKDKKILPARRGKLRKREAELAGLDEKMELELEEIDRNPTIVHQTVVCAGLVIGQ